jgi:hypothetical protein
MAVLYPSDELDPSSAAVADRLRKQAKTRAVRLVREAIACPNGGVTQDSGCPFPSPHEALFSLAKHMHLASNDVAPVLRNCSAPRLLWPARRRLEPRGIRLIPLPTYAWIPPGTNVYFVPRQEQASREQPPSGKASFVV